MWRNRQPKGQSTGGQFSRGRKNESQVRLGYFAPTPGHIRHQQWIKDNMPEDLQNRIDHCDDEGLFLTTENGLHRIKIDPGTGHSPTKIIGESYTELVTVQPNASHSDQQNEFFWAYHETLSMDVADRIGKQAYRDTTNPDLEPITRVNAQTGQTIPTVHVDYRSSESLEISRHEYPLYDLPPQSNLRQVTRDYFKTLSTDPDYSPGYRHYAKTALEQDDLLRDGTVPASMVESAFDKDEDRHHRGEAQLDPTGRYLDMTVNDGLTTPHRLRYDVRNDRMTAYYVQNPAASGKDVDEQPIPAHDLYDLQGTALGGLRALHFAASAQRNQLSTTLRLFRESREDQR